MSELWSEQYATVNDCSQVSIYEGKATTALGKNGHEGSIPFTRFRLLVPRELQRGRLRFRLLVPRELQRGRLRFRQPP
jgi:hypothetical protein